MRKTLNISLIVTFILLGTGFAGGQASESGDQFKNIVSVSGCVNGSTIITSEKLFNLGQALEICGGLTEKASTRIIQIYRFNQNGKLSIKTVQLPEDYKEPLKNRDMVVVRDKSFWSSRTEQQMQIDKIIERK
jgi:protein involved in polysaccharide export with SLBB domain